MAYNIQPRRRRARVLTPSRACPLPPLPPATPATSDLGALSDTFFRYKITLLVSMLGCALAAWGFTWLQPPKYRAQAAIEMLDSPDPVLQPSEGQTLRSPAKQVSDADLETQIAVLRSRALMEWVLTKLDLSKYTRNTAELRQSILDRLDSDLSLRVLANSRVITITYSAPNPHLAADIPNALARESIDQALERRIVAGRRTKEWLAGQVSALKAKLQASEDQLNSYARNAGLDYGEHEARETVDQEKLRQLQQELSAAQGDRIARESRYTIAAGSRPESIPDNGATPYETRLAELRRQLAEQSTILKPTHYKVRQLEAQIAETETALRQERDNGLARMRTEMESARRREGLVASAVARQAAAVSAQQAKAIWYNMLKREVDTNRQIYSTVLQRVNEANIESALRSSNIGIVDSAVVPKAPYSPRPVLNLVAGLASGLFLGVLLVRLRDRSDRSLRKPGELAAYAGIREIGVIPSGAATALVHRRGLAAGKPVELITARSERSPMAEAFKSVLASVVFGPSQPRVLAITSPGTGEGKTTASTNLAIALARLGRKVLLIDSDLRRPRLHTIFGISNDTGLADLLAFPDHLCPEDVAEVVRPTGVDNVSVLSSGHAVASPADLLHSARLDELIGLCLSSFDTIVADTPPVLELADARLLARVVDGVVLVCRAGATERDRALFALHRMAEDGVPVLGAILNDWTPGVSGYTYPYSKHDA